VVCLAGGCSRHGGGPAADGPLSSAAFGSITGGANCAPGGEAQTFGTEVFTNHGQTSVVLDRVVLLRPRNERLLGSYAVPGTFMIGVVPWPPRYADMPPTWKYREPVHAFSQGMRVYYHDSAGSYVATDHLAMIIALGKNGCN
jgi:hypothetical protein